MKYTVHRGIKRGVYMRQNVRARSRRQGGKEAKEAVGNRDRSRRRSDNIEAEVKILPPCPTHPKTAQNTQKRRQQSAFTHKIHKNTRTFNHTRPKLATTLAKGTNSRAR